jgi:translation initiation factor IF-3
MDYPEIALEDLREIVQDLVDVAVVEVPPQMEGRTMLVVLSPAKGAAAKKKEKGEQAEAKSEASPTAQQVEKS